MVLWAGITRGEYLIPALCFTMEHQRLSQDTELKMMQLMRGILAQQYQPNHPTPLIRRTNKMVTLRLGHQYIRRDGSTTAPLVLTNSGSFPYKDPLTGATYRPDGSWWSEPTEHDLIKEVAVVDRIAADSDYEDSIKLEVGRRYLRRDGLITGKLVIHQGGEPRHNGVVDYPYYDPDHDEIYAEDGTWNLNADRKDHRDLVSPAIPTDFDRIVDLEAENTSLRDQIQQLKKQINEIYGKIRTEGTPSPDLYRQAVTAEQIEDNLTKKPKTYDEGLDAGIEVLQSYAEQMLVEALELNRTTDLSKRVQAIEIARGYLTDVEFLVELKAKEHTL